MEKIKVIIDWDQNFGAASEMVPGCVATARTFDEAKAAYMSAFEFHLEGLRPEELPEFASKKYELEFELSAQALLHRFDGYITRAALSRATGINAKQLGHYMSGHRTPRADKRKKIVEGLHRLGEEFISVI